MAQTPTYQVARFKILSEAQLETYLNAQAALGWILVSAAYSQGDIALVVMQK